MTLESWLGHRTPPVPEGFRRCMEPTHPDAPASVDALAAEAMTALSAALEPGDLPRRGAFHLLAADGFLTYACEAALEEDDPQVALEGLVRRLTG